MPAPVLVGAIALASILTAWAAQRDLQIAPWRTLALVSLAALAASLSFGITYAPVAVLTVICALIVETDRRHQLIPDGLTLAVLVLAFAMPFGDALSLQLIGAAALGGMFLLIRQACTAWRGVEALGLGDVKLAAGMGAVLGPVHGFAAVAVAGAATLLVLTARSRGGAVAVGAPFGIGLASATAALAVIRALAP